MILKYQNICEIFKKSKSTNCLKSYFVFDPTEKQQQQKKKSKTTLLSELSNQLKVRLDLPNWHISDTDDSETDDISIGLQSSDSHITFWCLRSLNIVLFTRLARAPSSLSMSAI